MATPVAPPPSTLGVGGAADGGAPEPDPAQPDPARRVPAHDAWWWVAAAASVTICLYLHWLVARSATAPRTPWDEIHPIQTARLFAGQDGVTPLSGSGYYPGWSILLAPIWWFTEDPATVYHAAVTTSNVLAVLTIVPLALLGRRLGLTLAQATTAAAVVMCFPGRTVLADYALSEQPLLFLIAWAVLAMHALWTRPTWWRTVLFVVAVAACYLMHSRELALVATAAVWLLLLVVRRWQVTAVGLPLLAVLTVAVRTFSDRVHSEILIGGGGGKEELLGRVMESGTPSLYVRILLNQSWAQGVGTAGLAVLGAVVLTVWALREVRRWRIGPGVFLFGACLSALLLSVLWWTRPDFLWAQDGYLRLDVWIYTRYVDHMAVFLVLVALVVLIRGVGRGPLLAALGLFAAVSGAVVLWVAQDVALWGALDGPANSAALLSWTEMFPDEPYALPQQPTPTNENRFWFWASLFGVAMLCLALVLRRRPRVLVTVLLVTAFVLSVEADPSQKRDEPVHLEGAVERVEAATGGELVDIDLDYSCRGPDLTRYQMVNWLGYWLSPRDVDLADPPGGVPFDSDYVVSCGDWDRAEEYGARRVEDSGFYTYTLWVLPGEDQDELEEAGLLAP
ncbi:hypothetical protein ACT3SP_10660 [Brachybacterium sp. AOP43-C2-M15]|uniref:hypothetical protein n=1 Tax=Brachybacterium sp. AOP43-C2-M15 TaxID=3457661 RepID=UPI004033FF74